MTQAARRLGAAQPLSAPPSTGGRAALQEERLPGGRRLLSSQIAASLALPAAATAGGLLAVDVAGPSAAALPLASTVAGSGLAAVLASRANAQRSRDRPGGLRGAYTTATLGALLVVAGVGQASLPLLLAGSGLFGAGNAAAMLARYAAADLAPPCRRGSALSRMLLALTVGAVAAPNLLGPAAGLARPFGLPDATGLFLLAALAFAAAAILLPPLPAAGEATESGLRLSGRAGRWRWQLPRAALAPLAVLAVANLAMVTVMAVIPPLLHSFRGPARPRRAARQRPRRRHVPPRPARRTRRRPSRTSRRRRCWDPAHAPCRLLAGLSGALTARPLYAAGVLLLVGLAWSTQVVAASTWLTLTVPAPAQARAEGAGEAAMSAAAALCGLAAAPLLATGGTRALMAAIVIALIVTTLTLRRRRE